jgi:hypothetical protein
MAELITNLTQAVKLTFNGNYPVDEFKNLHVSPEFPILEENFPAVWVDFSPAGDLHTGGIDQLLYTEPDENNVVHAYKKWLFQGRVQYTIMALSSLERDRLFDEMVKMMAFGQLNPQLSIFRQTIEDNPWVATNIDFDQIGQEGKVASGGTPWGSDDMLYEITLTAQCLGEFASDPSTGEFLLLEHVKWIMTELPDGPVTEIVYPNS